MQWVSNNLLLLDSYNKQKVYKVLISFYFNKMVLKNRYNLRRPGTLLTVFAAGVLTCHGCLEKRVDDGTTVPVIKSVENEEISGKDTYVEEGISGEDNYVEKDDLVAEPEKDSKINYFDLSEADRGLIDEYFDEENKRRMEIEAGEGSGVSIGGGKFPFEVILHYMKNRDEYESIGDAQEAYDSK